MKKLTFYCLLALLWPFVSTTAQDTVSIRGSITNAQNGEPLQGATVGVKNSPKATASSGQGRYLLQGLSATDILLVSCVGYSPREMAIGNASTLDIALQPSSDELDQAVVLGYGSTTKKYNTGSVGRLAAADINRMPVSNALSALQGRVAGLSITQTNGLPGSTYNVLVRGKGSLFSGTQPLYVLDGVPFMQNRNLGQLQTAMGASPLNAINPADIESIEVLKDADATAIYGAQGANGVILITTKKAAAGKTKIDLNYYGGGGVVARSAAPMLTADYIAMRRQAFANDGTAPTISNAPDLLLWDTTAQTDWRETLTGGTAHIHNMQASISGGTGSTRFLLSGNYNGQTTVFPESKPTRRVATYFNLSHVSPNNRFKTQLNASYSVFSVQGPVNDLSASVYLPPNAPALYDSLGKLNWTNWNGIDNPMAQLKRQYKGNTYTLNSNLVLEYRLLPGLWIKASAGFNQLRQDERRANPISSKRPATTARGEADWLNAYANSWIAEPQVNYKKALGDFALELTGGLSFQQRVQESFTKSGSNYTDDDLLGNPLSAGQMSIGYNTSAYRYMAGFGRTSLQFKSRYLLNLNGRRDGSSRFGPAERFSNFGAIGAGWIFSEEPFIKKGLPFLSYGKLRGSYGVTGNDQVGDYAFLDAWSAPTTGPYQGSVTLAQSALYNPYLRWEKMQKLEIAGELGFMKNRLLTTVAWYQNRGGNQLTGYRLPTQTGFSSINANLDALLENSGWEIELNAKLVQAPAFQWQSSLVLTVPNSRLLAYPDLATSNNRFSYAIGEPLESFFGYQYTGIDPATGRYNFLDLNKDGKISVNEDYLHVGALRQEYYGGFQNLLSYQGLELELFIQFVKQEGKNWLATMPTVPGNLGNQPALLLNETVQKYTASASGAVTQAYRNFQQSSALISDASFLRLKNLSLSYRLPAAWVSKMKLGQLRVYVQGQNLFTITGYKGADPETQSLLALPPIKMLVAGIQVGL